MDHQHLSANKNHNPFDVHSRIWLQHLFDSLEEAVLVVSPDRRLLKINQATIDMFGYTFDEIAEQSTAVLHVDQAHYEEFGARIKRAFECGEPARFEYEVKRKNGEVFPSDHTVTLLRDGDGDPIGIVSVVRDITERHRARERDRTMAERLRQSQKLESLGVLAGGIAHDFNNLLTAILANVSLLRLDVASGHPTEGYLADIDIAVRRATDLVHQMLAYSGRGKFIIERTNLNQLVGEMSRLLQSSISKSVKLQLRFEDSLPEIECDRAQIQQIVMNLITNASEAIGDGEGVVTLRTDIVHGDAEYLAEFHHADDIVAGRFVSLEVADNGVGMTPETLERLFEPFFTTKFTGRGLGMSAVLGIIRSHGGAIKVYSETGRGTSVRVLLPAPAASAARATPRQAIPDRGRVLVVDDEDIVRNAARHILERLGFSVEVAVDGKDALELLARRPTPPTLVLLDLSMPRLNGIECYRALRARYPDLPVILTSGFSQDETIEALAAEAPPRFLQKPLDFDTLRRAVSEALEHEPGL
jgi:two-component system cell cycle sensor histidine kinase/response regulator CckA